MFYYVNTFLFYSIVGFINETILKTFFFHDMNNGILYGPWIPVYGFGAVIIVVMLRTVFNRLKVSRFWKIIILFISLAAILTLLEYLGGILIKLLFHKTFWDYSHFKYNFGPFIALEMTLVWTVCSIIFVYIIKPIVDQFIKKIPKFVTILVLCIFFIDVIITVLTV